MQLPAPQTWPAPAKLNLMLRITGRREDGYHELQTVFQFLTIADELTFSVREDGQIQNIRPIPGVADEHNLCIRAARLLQKTFNTTLGTDIEIIKNLPMGGGLGGGSSDAATTLLALNQLWQTGLDIHQLANLGVQLGADVPVFVHGQAAWAEGIGEKLTPVNLPTPWFLILQPPVHVSTAAIFSDSDLTRDAERITIRDFLAGQVDNHCLPVVEKHHPEVRKALNWLNIHAKARLTGTGGCVFAEFGTRQEAERVQQQAPEIYTSFVTRGVNKSPVMQLMQRGV